MTATAISLSTLVSVLSSYPDLLKTITLDDCIRYIELIRLIKPTLSLYQPPGTAEHLPLTGLPVNALEFLKRCLKIEHETAKILWVALCPIAWSQDLTADQIEAFGPRYLQLFLDHGSALGLGEKAVLLLVYHSIHNKLQPSMTFYRLYVHASNPAAMQRRVQSMKEIHMLEN